MYEKITLVTRKTRLEGLIERFNTRSQARFYIEHSGASFDFYEQEHEVYYAALEALRGRLQGLLKLHVIERSFLPNYLFTAADVVVTIGVDGLVVNTAKYLDGQPLVAVNPDPARIDGVLLPFRVDNAAEAVHAVLKGQAHTQQVCMAQARLNDAQTLLAFNDLFIGVRSHISARYQIHFGAQQENQSSSGIIVSTGAGATGWLSSLFNMAEGLYAGINGQAAPLSRPALGWDAERLIFVVREPFVSKTSTAGIVCGLITPEASLQIESHMPENGVIFSDGVEADTLAFNAGSRSTITLADRKTNLVVG